MIAVLVNPMYTARELRHQLKDSGATVLIVLDNFGAVAAESIGGYRLDLPTLTYDPAVLDHLHISTDKLAEIRTKVAEAIKAAPDFAS